MWYLIMVISHGYGLANIDNNFVFKTKMECQNTLSVLKKDLTVNSDSIELRGSCVFKQQ